MDEISGDDPSPVRVNKLGHLVYEVSDVEKTVKFWTEVMGFTLSDRNKRGMAFLRLGADHHAIALMPATPENHGQGRAESDKGLRMRHLAFEVDNVDMLFKARDWLRRNDVEVAYQGRAGPGCNVSLHILDPDGFAFELYCEMDQIGADGRTRPADQFRPADSLEDAIAVTLAKDW